MNDKLNWVTLQGTLVVKVGGDEPPAKVIWRCFFLS